MWTRSTLFALIGLSACSAAAIQPAPQAALPALGEAPSIESTEPYARSGFLVGQGSMPFVGMVRYVGTESLDTTAMLLAISIPPRTLSFVRAGDRYAAFYSVKIDVLSGGTVVRSERPTGEVRLASLQETLRGDEGVIFQRTLRVAPGTYTLRVTAQDSLGSGYGNTTGPITVPIMANGVIAPLIPVFAVDPRRNRKAPLTAVANPRATVRYGRDSTLQLYVEAYGSTAPDTVLLSATRERDPTAVIFRDTVVIPRQGEVRSRRFDLPTSTLGLGVIDLLMTRASGAPIGSGVAVVSLGEDVPVTSMDELLDALRYFASDAELLPLREAKPDSRPALWNALMHQTDPNPATPVNEAFHEYVRRLNVASSQYREDARPGWQTDRGSVILALGEPDSMSEPQPADSSGTARLVTWEYRRYRLLLVFADQSGFGRWKLTPASDLEFHGLLTVAGPCVGCR